MATNKKVENKKAKPCVIKKQTAYVGKYQHLLNKHFTEDEIVYLADEMLKWFQVKKNYWLKDFANSKLISRNRIAEFCKRNVYFEFIYLACKEIQESKLLSLGLDKQYNTAMPIFALKNVCEWSDRVNVNGLSEEETERLRQIANSEMINNL